MKASELMIGDWVKFPIGNDKVVDLPYIEGRGVCASFAASATLFPVEVYKLEPIPLTPEILEKNFTSTNNVFGFKNYEIGKEFILENRGERFCLSRIFFGHKYSTFYITDIFSIHELQHTLKLCGIDKEIMV